MPAVKPIPKPPKDTANATLVLFAQNLEAIHLWYRGASYAGQQVGHVVLSELIINNVTHALALALQGEHWVAPLDGP